MLAIVISAASSCLLLSACGSSDEERVMAQETKKPLGIGNTDKANAELENAVRAKLHSDPQLAGITVSADVTRNQVTLSGTVASEALRDKAAELAKSGQVGVVVNNKINVKSKAANSS
jgi:osmotically-inducible protein OsmY